MRLPGPIFETVFRFILKFFVSGLQKRKVLVSMKLCGLWRPEGQLYHAYEIGLSRVRRGVPIQGDNSMRALMLKENKRCMNAMCIQT